MKFKKPILLGLALLGGQLCASAAEMAVLRNGSSIPFLRKEEMGATTRLYITGGYMDVATSEIASFDKDESPAPPTVSDQAKEQPAATAQVPAPSNASATPAKVDIDQLVREASSRHQLDPDFVSSVIKAESNFHTRAVSRKGAQGLMQLMPQTAAKLGVKDAFDPQANVEAGTAHLSALLDMYHNDPIKALAAYNAGAHRVQQYHGVPPYYETRVYVAKIVRDFNAKKRAQAAAEKKPANRASAPAAKAPSAQKPASSAKATNVKPAASQPRRASSSKQANGPA
ncbi:MAG TPA: lytic transglycosylase domain-containing protein [Terriglobales bacterium]|nr:lytic transglycosylase domain-containing protein [Terriglobales bacterium]